MKQKALRAGDAHSARECAEAHSFLYFCVKLQGKGMKFRKK